MPEPAYLAMLDNSELRIAFAALHVAEALAALGWPVCPIGDDMEAWKIGDFVLTDEELIGLAARQGIAPAAETMQ